MPTKIVDTILPTTMVGSYPRPRWFRQQLRGRDIRVAFKEVEHEEAYADATKVAIDDQESAGLDIVTDGQMYFDDYVGGIGAFCWYMYERIGGFREAKEPHPLEAGAAVRTKEIELFADWGGVINDGPVSRGPVRLADLYKIAAKCAKKPIKVSVGAGPINLAWHVYYKHYTNPKELSLALAKIAWHFCFGNAWGNSLKAIFPKGYEAVLPQFYDVPVEQFVLDFANREMADIEILKSLPKDKEVQIGVLDIRTMMIESPEEVAARIQKVIKVVPPDRVYLSTDCGMKNLPRLVAKMKLKALADGARMVRKEL